MTTLDELERLALAAITHEPSDHGKLSSVQMQIWQDTLDDFHDEAQPECILALIACVRAADEKRKHVTPQELFVWTDYDSARAALEDAK